MCAFACWIRLFRLKEKKINIGCWKQASLDIYESSCLKLRNVNKQLKDAKSEDNTNQMIFLRIVNILYNPFNQFLSQLRVTVYLHNSSYFCQRSILKVNRCSYHLIRQFERFQFKVSCSSWSPFVRRSCSTIVNLY